jgi:hypothetical protein
MKIGHLFLSIFEIKKKVLKTIKLSVFSISLKLIGEMESDGGIVTHSSIKKPTTYQKILRNREFHIFLQESRFRGIF